MTKTCDPARRHCELREAIQTSVPLDCRASLAMTNHELAPSNLRINPVLPAKVNPLTTIDAGVPSRNSSNWGGDSGAKLRLSRGVPPDSEGFERGQWS
jgi:hypothetical protein